jgi:hypothetical protein
MTISFGQSRTSRRTSCPETRGPTRSERHCSSVYVVVHAEHRTPRRAHEQQLEVLPLSKFAMRPLRRGGLVLGFAAVEPARTRNAVPQLRKIIDSLDPGRERPIRIHR